MTAIEKVTPEQARVYTRTLDLDDDEKKGMEYCLTMSAHMWVCLVDSGLLCIWGLIPPSFLSNQAYLWLYTTDLLEEHQFILVRHSQLVVEQCLEEYSSICGHVLANNSKAIRWLKWLGAKFGYPQGMGIPFRITRNG